MDYETLLLIGVLPLMLIGQIYLLGRKMSTPEKMMSPITTPLSSHQREVISRHSDWLNSVNLEFRTAFKFGAIHAVVFQQKDQPRFFSFMFHQKITFSASSSMDDLTTLDTSNSGDIGLFPRPGAYAQSFPGISAQETWQRHLEGEAHLTKMFGYQWVPIKRSIEEMVLDGTRIRMQYNRSQSFWPVRVLYRYFITRRRMANRTIMQQFPTFYESHVGQI
jgi:hypothetical protein